jgi:hypothetical protein
VTNRLMRFDACPGKTTYHLCIAAADRRRLGSYPEVLGQASLQLRMSHPWRDHRGAVDHELHKFDESHEMRIGMVHDGDATCSNFTIDGGEAAEENIIEHENGVLANPVPGRAEVTDLKRVELAEYLQYKCHRAHAQCCPVELESARS